MPPRRPSSATLIRVALPFLAAALPLAACSSLKQATGTPTMSPITYPAALVPKAQEVLGSRDETPRPASANSLWRNGSRTFFHDQRASRVGDILTVDVQIADTAQLANETVANRTSTANAGIVRPEDITSSNTISHTQIAEARVSYGGKGQVTQMQRTPAGQALVAQYSPF